MLFTAAKSKKARGFLNPGSEGESEGEGSDSEDEIGEGGYDEGDTAEVGGEDEEMED